MHFHMPCLWRRDEKIPPHLLRTRDTSCTPISALRRMKESSHVFEKRKLVREQSNICTYRNIGTHRSRYVFWQKGPFCIFLLLFSELWKGDLILPHTSSSATKSGTPLGRTRLEDKEFYHILLESTFKWNGLWEQNIKDEETSCRSDHFCTWGWT